MDELGKTYRPWDPFRNQQQAYSPATVLPEDDLVFFLLDTVPQLDLAPFYAYYERETRGAPPFDVPMIVYAARLCLQRGCVFQPQDCRGW